MQVSSSSGHGCTERILVCKAQLKSIFTDDLIDENVASSTVVFELDRTLQSQHHIMMFATAGCWLTVTPSKAVWLRARMNRRSHLSSLQSSTNVCVFEYVQSV